MKIKSKQRKVHNNLDKLIETPKQETGRKAKSSNFDESGEDPDENEGRERLTERSRERGMLFPVTETDGV